MIEKFKQVSFSSLDDMKIHVAVDRADKAGDYTAVVYYKVHPGHVEIVSIDVVKKQ